ncbi:hypothetical protein [Haloglomus litoreum]|uniref:hypothetical protein n=1 Tax=Haloglomus litoreum TaxID=3034026 RepID=UPI0023E873E3|nr:hypothetical protein [Haloglomus sp. DT116]
MNRRQALRQFHRSRTTDERWLPGESGSEGVGRRTWLKRLGAAVVGVGAAKALDNVVVGYGVVTGTNLTEQSMASLVSAPFAWNDRWVEVPGGRIELSNGGERLSLRGAGSRSFIVGETTPERAREAAAAVGVDPDAAEQAVADIRAFREGAVRYEPLPFDEFGAAAAEGTARPATTGLMRAILREVDPAAVAAFVGVHPSEPVALAPALAEAFREHTYYDLPRYAAGSVEDNVIMGAADLRRYFESPTSFEALASGETSGMFCYEFTFRSVQAFHAQPALDQSPPVAACKVFDERHKHVYTALATVTRRDGDLVVPMTFVDYTHTTLYDDLNLRGVMGEGLNGYTSRHRATELRWWSSG